MLEEGRGVVLLGGNEVGVSVDGSVVMGGSSVSLGGVEG